MQPKKYYPAKNKRVNKGGSMQMIQMSATYEYLFKLIEAAFTGQIPEEKPENVSWETLYRESKRQNVFMLVYDSVKRLKNGPSEQSAELWKTYYDKLLAKSINQSVEIEKLLALFEEKNIRVLPLKGFFLRDLYPTRELREMSDFDLLVEDDRSGQMQQIMASLGYSAGNAVDHHAEYKKRPYVTIELHNKLLPDRVGRRAYYEDIWQRCALCEGRKTVYHTSKEDFLIFILLHFEKHYYTAGCGIRFLIDIHAILRSWKDQLDMAYFRKEIEKLSMTEFTDTVFCLEQEIFAQAEETPDARQMLEKMIHLGVFGSRAGREMNIIDSLTPKSGNKKIGKLRYYFRIVFPPLCEMQEQFPVLCRVSFLLPVFWVWRGIKTVFCNPKHISNHYKRIMSYGNDKK